MSEEEEIEGVRVKWQALREIDRVIRELDKKTSVLVWVMLLGWMAYIVIGNVLW